VPDLVRTTRPGRNQGAGGRAGDHVAGGQFSRRNIEEIRSSEAIRKYQRSSVIDAGARTARGHCEPADEVRDEGSGRTGETRVSTSGASVERLEPVLSLFVSWSERTPSLMPRILEGRSEWLSMTLSPWARTASLLHLGRPGATEGG